MTAAQIIAVMDAIASLLKIINQAIAKGRERGEWTPEQEAEFDAKLTEIGEPDHWKIQ
jgi:hypothetical protein